MTPPTPTIEQLQRQVAAVADLHGPYSHPDGKTLCRTCWQAYPCATLKAMYAAKDAQ